VSRAHRDLELPAMMRTAFESAARAWLEEPTCRAEPRDAASVLLLREASTRDGSRVEVFVQRRVAAMAFAASMHAYPGGGVRAEDGDGDLAWAGPGRTPAWWAGVLGVDDQRARLIVLAAVREVFEECGVLFADPTPGTPSDLRQRWPAHRAALVAGTRTLGELIRRESLRVRSDLLHPVARWVTPACEALRYDTFFFAATVPVGQVADGRTSEVQTAAWVEPGQLLHADTLMAPTRLLAEQLNAAESLGEFFRGQPSLAPVRPYPVNTPAGIRLRVPVGPGKR